MPISVMKTLGRDVWKPISPPWHGFKDQGGSRLVILGRERHPDANNEKNLIAMACTLVAMASNLIAMAVAERTC